MGLSNAPGETRNNQRNTARMVVTLYLNFSDQALLEQAPQWDKTAVGLLRKLLEQNKDAIPNPDELNKSLENYNLEDILSVNSVYVEAAS